VISNLTDDVAAAADGNKRRALEDAIKTGRPVYMAGEPLTRRHRVVAVMPDSNHAKLVRRGWAVVQNNIYTVPFRDITLLSQF